MFPPGMPSRECFRCEHFYGSCDAWSERELQINWFCVNFKQKEDHTKSAYF